MWAPALLAALCLSLPASCRRPGTKWPEVQTPLGRLRGSLMETSSSRWVFAFRGVPYAKPPVGQRRFKNPSPVDPWDGVLNVTKDGAWCPSPWAPNGGAENCLFLNVYTTKLPDKEENPRRPVMVFLHPGGFYSMRGTSDFFGPQYILDEDIVLVTLNYRLGALGFLSTGDSVLPGNYGFKDQVQALRWIQQNIEYFGGDPMSVTLVGYSAGSISVLLHMISPMSRGLFHQGVAMSGGIQRIVIPDNLKQAKKQARLLNCPERTSEEIVNCLRGKDAMEIAGTIEQFAEWGTDPILRFGAAIEQDYGDGAERFLTSDPNQQFISGNFSHIPIILGTTKDEFSYKALHILANSSLAEDMSENYEKIFPILFSYDRNITRSGHVSRKLKQFYFGNQPITNSSRTHLGQLYADGITIFPMDRIAKILSRKNTSPVYYYQFTYQGKLSWVKAPGSNKPYGVVHHDDLMYLFYISVAFPSFIKSEPEYLTVRRMTKMWSNFAKNGNPTSEKTDQVNVDWEALTPSRQVYMEIGPQLTLKEGLYYQDRLLLWEKLLPLPAAT